jgi:hypothetical protein
MKNLKDLKGKTLYFFITDVSKSGMSRKMRVFIIVDERLVEVTLPIAQTLGMPMTTNGLRVHAAPMDMCFFLVDALERQLKLGILKYQVL